MCKQITMLHINDLVLRYVATSILVPNVHEAVYNGRHCFCKLTSPHSKLLYRPFHIFFTKDVTGFHVYVSVRARPSKP